MAFLEIFSQLKKYYSYPSQIYRIYSLPYNLAWEYFWPHVEKQDCCHRRFFRLSARTFAGPLEQRVL